MQYWGITLSGMSVGEVVAKHCKQHRTFELILCIGAHTDTYLSLCPHCLLSGLMKWWKLRQAMKEAMEIPQWEEDYKLSALPDHHMFWEYLEVGKILPHGSIISNTEGRVWRHFQTSRRAERCKYEAQRSIFDELRGFGELCSNTVPSVQYIFTVKINTKERTAEN